MAAVVDIVNRALISIGAQPIISIDQAGKAATSAKAIYDQVRDHVLRSHPWNCATRRVVLAPLVAVPEFEWGKKYALPGDCLRVLEVNGQSWPTQGWQIEGRELLTNEVRCELLYIWRNEDTGQYDPGLVTALAAQLAFELATPLSALPSVVDRAEARAEAALTEATRTDGQEEELVENPLEAGWVMARFE